MAFDEKTVLELKDTWQTLTQDAQKNKKIKFAMFETAFSQTYGLLAEHGAEPTLDKQCVRVVAEAFLFASLKDDALESMCLAATVLTERMLKNFAFRCAPDIADTAVIYILENHEEIHLDFKDVDESISRLTKAYDAAYWRKLGK